MFFLRTGIFTCKCIQAIRIIKTSYFQFCDPLPTQGLVDEILTSQLNQLVVNGDLYLIKLSELNRVLSSL